MAFSRLSCKPVQRTVCVLRIAVKGTVAVAAVFNRKCDFAAKFLQPSAHAPHQQIDLAVNVEWRVIILRLLACAEPPLQADDAKIAVFT